jgi:hypothetical protein
MIVCLFIIIVLHPPEFECIDLPLGILATSSRFVAQAQPSAAKNTTTAILTYKLPDAGRARMTPYRSPCMAAIQAPSRGAGILHPRTGAV